MFHTNRVRSLQRSPSLEQCDIGSFQILVINAIESLNVLIASPLQVVPIKCNVFGTSKTKLFHIVHGFRNGRGIPHDFFGYTTHIDARATQCRIGFDNGHAVSVLGCGSTGRGNAPGTCTNHQEIKVVGMIGSSSCCIFRTATTATGAAPARVGVGSSQ